MSISNILLFGVLTGFVSLLIIYPSLPLFSWAALPYPSFLFLFIFILFFLFFNNFFYVLYIYIYIYFSFSRIWRSRIWRLMEGLTSRAGRDENRNFAV